MENLLEYFASQCQVGFHSLHRLAGTLSVFQSYTIHFVKARRASLMSETEPLFRVRPSAPPIADSSSLSLPFNTYDMYQRFTINQKRTITAVISLAGIIGRK